MQDAFCLVDKDWKIILVNQNYEHITRSKRSDHIGKYFWDIYPEMNSPTSTYWREYKKVRDTKQASEFEAFYSPLHLWTEVRANPTSQGGIALFFRDITQKKLAEENAAKSDIRFKELADSMPQIVFISDKNGFPEYLNKQWYEYTGLSEATLGNMNWDLVIHPEDLILIAEEWRKCTSEERPLSINCRLKTTDGNYRWQLVRSVPIRNKQNEIENWFGTSTDIHELRTTQEELKNNEEKFEALANNIPQLAWMGDGEGWVFWYNQRWIDYTGETLENMEGWQWNKVHHPDHVHRVTEGFKRHLISGKPWEDIYPIRGKNGTYRWFLSRATPIRNKEGKIIRWFGTNTDIDEQVKIEAMLNESQNHFRQLANSIPHIVWTAHADGYLDFYNDRFYEFTGMTETDEIEQSWESIVHPEDYARTLEIWDHSLKTGEPYHIEYRLKGRDEKYRWFLGLALPVRDNQKDIVKWFGSCTDIDDQKHLATELVDALDTRDEFLSIASHELKTPLTSLKLHSQMFKKRIARHIPNAYSPECIDALATQVDKQTSKLNRLVDDMLDISRIRTGKLTLRAEEFNLCSLVDDVFGILKEQFLSSNCPLPIFNCPYPQIKVTWDRVRIEQVLLNLLTNSIRYGKEKQVYLSVESTESNISISVKDQGIGIASENLEKVFDRFEKIRNPSEVSGLGLGLYISKQIIEAHHGKIWVESEVGVGSEFKIILPDSYTK